jgi:hypothetical protein
LILRGKAVEDTYGFTSRQQKRWVVERKISHVHPSGDNGPCYLLTAELEALIAATTKPAIQRHRGHAS